MVCSRRHYIGEGVRQADIEHELKIITALLYIEFRDKELFPESYE